MRVITLSRQGAKALLDTISAPLSKEGFTFKQLRLLDGIEDKLIEVAKLYTEAMNDAAEDISEMRRAALAMTDVAARELALLATNDADRDAGKMVREQVGTENADVVLEDAEYAFVVAQWPKEDDARWAAVDRATRHMLFSINDVVTNASHARIEDGKLVVIDAPEPEHKVRHLQKLERRATAAQGRRR